MKDKSNISSDTYMALREALYTDDAVVGESAAMAMGMVMAGSLDASAFNEMMQVGCNITNSIYHTVFTIFLLCLSVIIGCVYNWLIIVHVSLQYVVETQHDKIKRGLRIGISLLMYNRREEAEPFIQVCFPDP